MSNKEEIINSINYWDSIHKEYKRDEIKFDDWLNPYLDIIEKTKIPILDLGCGSGNNTLYLLNHNKEVIPCDQSINAIKNIKINFQEVKDARCFNMLDGMPFSDNSFEIVIADLCLHYFRDIDTKNILKEIRRILVNDGILLARLNSMNDINHGAGSGKEVEKHLFETDDYRLKRFFTLEDISYFFKDFDLKEAKEETMTRYKLEKKLFVVCAKNKK